MYGNLYLRGGGDPSLGSRLFGSSPGAVIESFRKAVRRAGIDSVKGAIVADARIFEYQMLPSGWTWGDLQTNYGTGVSGLSFAENVIWIKLKNGRINYFKPYPVPGLKVSNRLIISPKIEKNQIFWEGSPYENRRILKGAIKTDTATAQLPVPDPAFWCASALYRALRADSVFVADSVTTLRKAAWPDSLTQSDRTDLLVLPSPKLKHLARHTNTVSQNFYAETLLKFAGLKSGRYGGTYAGCAAVREFLEDQNIPVGGYFQTDGSGLSRFNAVTGRLMTDALAAFAKNEQIFESFYNSLAVAGRSGTLSKMCIGSPAENNVRAKSGTMQRIKAYAGYVRDRDGRLLVFSMISNNHECSAARMKAFFEKLMIAAAEIGGESGEFSEADSLQ